MRKKVWLARDNDGDYALCLNKPIDFGFIYYSHPHRAIIKGLCPEDTKKWLRLEKQLRKGSCVQGYFNVSFKPIKRKEK